MHGTAPPVIADNQLQLWVGSLPDTRIKVINALIRLVITLARAYSHYQPHKKDDIEAESLLSLCEAVDHFPSIKRDDNIVPYITTRVRGHIINFLGRDCIVPRRKTTDGIVMERIDTITDRQWEKLTDTKYDPVELNELIELATENTEDLEIFHMKRASYTLQEISNALGKSASYIHRRQEIIFGRFAYVWRLGDVDARIPGRYH